MEKKNAVRVCWTLMIDLTFGFTVFVLLANGFFWRRFYGGCSCSTYTPVKRAR